MTPEESKRLTQVETKVDNLKETIQEYHKITRDDTKRLFDKFEDSITVKANIENLEKSFDNHLDDHCGALKEHKHKHDQPLKEHVASHWKLIGLVALVVTIFGVAIKYLGH